MAEDLKQIYFSTNKAVISALDGSHVEVKVPTSCHRDYFNRKQKYSINLQGTVDRTGMFITPWMELVCLSHHQAILGSKTSQGFYPNTHQKALGLVDLGSANHQVEGWQMERNCSRQEALTIYENRAKNHIIQM